MAERCACDQNAFCFIELSGGASRGTHMQGGNDNPVSNCNWTLWSSDSDYYSPQCFRSNFSHPGFESHPWSLLGTIASGVHHVLHHVNRTGILKHHPKTKKTESKIESGSIESGEPLPSEPMTLKRLRTDSADRRKRHSDQLFGACPCNSQRAIQESIGENLVDNPVPRLVPTSERLELGEVDARRKRETFREYVRREIEQLQDPVRLQQIYGEPNGKTEGKSGLNEVDAKRRKRHARANQSKQHSDESIETELISKRFKKFHEMIMERIKGEARPVEPPADPDRSEVNEVDARRSTNSKKTKRDIQQPCDAMINGEPACKGQKAIHETIGEVFIDKPDAVPAAEARLELGEVGARRRKRNAKASRLQRDLSQPCDVEVNGKSVCNGVKAIQKATGETLVDTPVAPLLPGDRLELGEVDARRRKRHVRARHSKRHIEEPCDESINGESACHGIKPIQETIGEVLIEHPVAPPEPQEKLELGEVDAQRRKRDTNTDGSRRELELPCDTIINGKPMCGNQKPEPETKSKISIDITFPFPAAPGSSELGEVDAGRRKRNVNAVTPTIVLNHDLIIEYQYADYHNDDMSCHDEPNFEPSPRSLGDEAPGETTEAEETTTAEQALANSQTEAAT